MTSVEERKNVKDQDHDKNDRIVSADATNPSSERQAPGTLEETNVAQGEEENDTMSGHGRRRRRRPMCEGCCRPSKVCICESLPEAPIRLQKCHLLVLQHPHETKKHKSTNRSLPLVQLCLDPSSMTVAISRRFGDQIAPTTMDLLQKSSSKVLLIFPNTNDDGDCIEGEEEQQQQRKLEDNESTRRCLTLSEAREFCLGRSLHKQQDDNEGPNDKRIEKDNDKTTTNGERENEFSSKNKEDKEKEEGKVLIVILDATWKYAKEMDKANRLTKQYPDNMKRVALSWDDPLRPKKAIVPKRFDGIRTPPSEVHLSTAECIAWVLAALEEEEEQEEEKVKGNEELDDDDDDTYSVLMKPLDCMVAKLNECRKNATEKHHHYQQKQQQDNNNKSKKNKKTRPYDHHRKQHSENLTIKAEEQRDYSYYGNPLHHQEEEQQDDDQPLLTRASFFSQGDEDHHCRRSRHSRHHRNKQNNRSRKRQKTRKH